MDNTECIIHFLIENGADFEVIQQDKPILSVQDAREYYDVEKIAPVFILQTDNQLIAFIKSINSGRIDFSQLKSLLNCKCVEMAKPDIIKQQVGYEVGVIPLVGLSLPAVFDNKLLDHDYIYGGIGDMFSTLKILPTDVIRLNNVIATL